MIGRFAPPPCGAALPRADARVLALFRVPPTAHVHLTVLTSASPGHSPRPWLLEDSLPGRHPVGPCSGRQGFSERPDGVTPFPGSMVRIRRTGLSTGLLRQCTPVRIDGCRRRSLGLLAPARPPLALVRVHAGSSPLCWRCPERPARRDTRGEAARVRRFSPLQPLEAQSQSWGIHCHSCTGREGFTPAWNTELQGESSPCGLPGSRGFLSTHGSHLDKGCIDLAAAR